MLNFKRIFRRKEVFARSAQRFDCCAEGELVLSDSAASYDGRLINISAGGAMFRPKLAYLMSRRDVPVELIVDGIAIAGEIISTTPRGFGLRFLRPLDEAEILRIAHFPIAPRP